MRRKERGGGRASSSVRASIEGAKQCSQNQRILNEQIIFAKGFLSATQPTDQGKESVVLIVVGAGTIFHLLMYSFLGCEKEKLCLKRGVKRQKLFSKEV